MNSNVFRAGIAVSVFSVAGAANAQSTIWSEDFEDVGVLQKPVDETAAAWIDQDVWTTAPTQGLEGWTLTKNIFDAGVTEWSGWSFAKKDFWVSVAGDQTRSQFTKGNNIVAIADPDEYDDKSPGIVNAGYNVFMTTNAISLANLADNTITVTFDSSWRPEGFDDGDGTNNQTGKVRVQWDGAGQFTDVLHWDSNSQGNFFKGDAQNETITLTITRPNNARTMKLDFGLTLANNDWWWAVDNIAVKANVVPEPTTMLVLGLGALAVARRRRSK